MDSERPDTGQPYDDLHGQGVQVGDGNIQYNYFAGLTQADGVALPFRVSISGKFESPYRGLNAFEVEDQPFFFGREQTTDAVLERMSMCAAGRSGLLVVSGASGAGKSSLLRAGVLPRVRGAGLRSVPGADSWRCLIPFAPGRSPLDELAAQLAGQVLNPATIRRELAADPAGFALIARQAAPIGQRLLFVVDQFEQLFTECGDERERKAFIAALHAAAARPAADGTPAALVVLVMRADFETRCLAYPELTDAVQDRYLLAPMTARQLTMAITEPAKRIGSSVDGDLVKVLLRETSSRDPTPDDAASGSEAGVLPLLSHALDQAWRHRSGKMLTLEDYERTGGIEAAIARSAEQALGRLTDRQQEVARLVFIQLTGTSSDGLDIIVGVDRAKLAEGLDMAEGTDVTAVLESFAAERFLILAASTVEISHEILLTAWPTLRAWLSETHDQRRVLTRLRTDTDEWSRLSRSSSRLYRGDQLETAARTVLLADKEPLRYQRPMPTERYFLATSQRAATRRTWGWRALFAFVAVVALVMGSLAFVAHRETQAANQQRDLAVQQRDLAISQQAASEAANLADSEPGLAKQLAVAAYQVAPTPAAFSALFASQADPGTMSASGTTDAAFSSDGSLLALAGGARVEVWGMAAHAIVATLPPAALGTSIAFRPAASQGPGDLLAVGESNGGLELWDVAVRQVSLVATLAASGGPVEKVAFSPDGQLLAAAGGGRTVRLWNVTRPAQPLAVLSGGTSTASSVAFSPDGRILVTGDWDQTVRLWNIANPRQPALMAAIPDGQLVRSVAIDPTGQTLAIGGDGSPTDPANSLQLWNISDPWSPRHLADLDSGPPVTAVAFGATTRVLMASGPANTQVSLWDISKLAHPVALPSLDGGGQYLALSPGGQILATDSPAGDDVRIWNIVDPKYRDASAVLPGASNGPAVIDPDGRLVTVPSLDGTVLQLKDMADPAHPASLGQVADPTGVAAFADDGGRFLLATVDKGVISLRDTTDRQHVRELTQVPAGGVVIGLALDSGTLAALVITPSFTASNPVGTIRLWSIRNPSDAVPLASVPGAPAEWGLPPSGGGLAFGPGGQTLMDWVGQPTVNQVALWDLRTPARPVRITGLPSEITAAAAAALSPTAPILATGDANGIVRLWDLANPQHPAVMATLSGTSAQQQILMFSPDGTDLIGEDTQDVVHLWSAQSSWATTTVGTLPAWFETPTGAGSAGLSSVTLPGTPEGGRVLVNETSSGNDLISITPSALITQVCAQVGDPITEAQWGQYMASLPYRPPCPTAKAVTAAVSPSLAPVSLSPANIAAFAGTWAGHDRTLVIDPNGQFTVEVSVAGTPTSASGQLSSLSGAEAIGEVTQTTADAPAPRGPVVISLDVQTDTVTVNTYDYCGPDSAPTYCGA